MNKLKISNQTKCPLSCEFTNSKCNKTDPYIYRTSVIEELLVLDDASDTPDLTQAYLNGVQIVINGIFITFTPKNDILPMLPGRKEVELVINGPFDDGKGRYSIATHVHSDGQSRERAYLSYWPILPETINKGKSKNE
jgi:hypothetical protein